MSAKQPRRYDGRCGVKPVHQPIWMDIFQAHCDAFLRGDYLHLKKAKPQEGKPQ